MYCPAKIRMTLDRFAASEDSKIWREDNNSPRGGRNDATEEFPMLTRKENFGHP